MGQFPENVRRQAKELAAYRCVLCHEKPAFEVHHIEPSESGGSDKLDNAAALCPGCHALYGNDPLRRRFIREARDFWQAKVAEGPPVVQLIIQAGSAVEGLTRGPASSGAVDKTRDLLLQVSRQQAQVWERVQRSVESASTPQDLLRGFGAITSAAAISSNSAQMLTELPSDAVVAPSCQHDGPEFLVVKPPAKVGGVSVAGSEALCYLWTSR